MATKPTINEYDLVYVGLRPNSQPDYELLRTWILSLEEGAGVEDISYADLNTLITGNNLVPGQVYCITDFRTRQLIPNTADVNTGVVEPLCVMAINENTLATWAYSSANRNDQIVYDFQNSEFGADMGRIMYRKDTVNDNEAYFDFRQCVFRRWDDGSGNFVSITDNGNPSQDFTAFGDSAKCAIGYTEGVQANNVVKDSCDNIRMANQTSNITVETNCQGLNFDYGCALVTVFDTVANGSVGKLSRIISIDRLSSNINLGDEGLNITVGMECDNIQTGSNCSLLQIGASCNNINIMQSVSSSSLADGTFNTVITSGTANRIINQTSQESNQFHRPNFMQGYFEWDMATLGGTTGDKILCELPTGASVVSVIFQATGLTSGGAATIAFGVETDDPTGILPATAYNDPVFNGDVSQSATTPSPDAPTAAARDLLMTIAGAEITAGVMRVWIQVVVNAN